MPSKPFHFNLRKAAWALLPGRIAYLGSKASLQHCSSSYRGLYNCAYSVSTKGDGMLQTGLHDKNIEGLSVNMTWPKSIPLPFPVHHDLPIWRHSIFSSLTFAHFLWLLYFLSTCHKQKLSWKKGPQLKKMLLSSYLEACLQGIFLING